MDAFLRPKNDFLADKVTAAEVTSVYHTVQHATSYRAGGCGTKLATTIYPDSDIAKRMACGRTQRILTFHTETIANINNVLGYICCLACSTQYTQSRLRFDELCSGNKNIQIQKYME